MVKLPQSPPPGGMINGDDYENKVIARLTLGRDLRLASFMGTGLKALKVDAGDRASASDLTVDPGFGRAFELEPDRAWLSDFCAPLDVDVRW